MSEKEHAELGASSAERWLACPGSINLSRGLPDYSTEYSREGNAAHNLAETCLAKGLHPEIFVGLTMPDDEGGVVEVTDEMADAVKVFVDHARSRWASGVEHGIEKKFNLAELNPPGPMFGTTDHWAYDETLLTLYIDDYKHGVGVVKEAIENEQLMYYGIGGLLALGKGRVVEHVILTIVQPRAQHPDGIVRSWETSPAELLDFAGLLFEGARKTQDPHAPLSPGAHCRFCKAAGICPAKKQEAQALAQIEFETLPEYGPPAPQTLPIEVLADMATKFHILEAWMKAGKALIQAKLEHGEEVPGWKLVRKRATRSWKSDEDTEQFLRSKGYTPDDFNVEPKLKSPAQVEKLVGKKNLPADLVQSESSGFTLALEGDARPAIALSPGEEFPLLLAAPQEADTQ